VGCREILNSSPDLSNLVRKKKKFLTKKLREATWKINNVFDGNRKPGRGVPKRKKSTSFVPKASAGAGEAQKSIPVKGLGRRTHGDEQLSRWGVGG